MSDQVDNGDPLEFFLTGNVCWNDLTRKSKKREWVREDCITTSPNSLEYVLEYAIYADRADLVRDYLKCGGDPNIQITESGMTCLGIAAEYGRTEIVETLLADERTDPNLGRITTPLWRSMVGGPRSKGPLLALLEDERVRMSRINYYYKRVNLTYLELALCVLRNFKDSEMFPMLAADKRITSDDIREVLDIARTNEIKKLYVEKPELLEEAIKVLNTELAKRTLQSPGVEPFNPVEPIIS
jgi:hypothetical protein